MPARPDFVVYSADEVVQLAVEVKFRLGASDEWAEQFRRNLLAHSIIPEVRYFLLVLPEHSYLWGGASEGGEATDRLRIETPELLRAFVSSFRSRPSNEESLELAVNAWLIHVTNLPREEVANRYGWLLSSGVYDHIRGGHVEHRAAA